MRHDPHFPRSNRQPGEAKTSLSGRPQRWVWLGSDRGQATAEYALVLLAAAALAGLALAWATSTDAVDRLFDAVVESIVDDVSE